jgi:hypothetical protein
MYTSQLPGLLEALAVRLRPVLARIPGARPLYEIARSRARGFVGIPALADTLHQALVDEKALVDAGLARLAEQTADLTKLVDQVAKRQEAETRTLLRVLTQVEASVTDLERAQALAQAAAQRDRLDALFE